MRNWKQKFGEQGEALAVRRLKKAGYKIIETGILKRTHDRRADHAAMASYVDPGAGVLQKTHDSATSRAGFARRAQSKMLGSFGCHGTPQGDPRYS